VAATDAHRTLSERELNRALLARQHLLERSSAPIPRVLEEMAGLQAQYAPSMYIGLWSRIEGLERSDVTEALEWRTVVQGTLMRATIHLVSADDYWPFALGIREARRVAWARVSRRGLSEEELAAAARRLREALADGPLRRKEIEALLGDRLLANGVGIWLDLVRVPPSGTWERRRADLYGLAEEWLGPPDVTPEQGVDLLVRRYLGGFGPAPVGDVANWAGLPAREVAGAIEGMGLRRFRDERGDELLDLPDAPLPDAEAPAAARFLPTWDASLLVHARRTGILPEEHRPKVFNTKTPQSVPTFLVDGQVAGTWRYETGCVAVEPFGRLDAATRRELDAEGERLAAFHG
jgi:winged helix DNA-binding protein